MSDAESAEIAARLARRYPARRTDWRVLAVVLAVIGGGWLIWAAWDGAHPAVSARIDAFDVRSTTETDVVVTIERADTARPAECLLYGQAVSYERVGELPLTVAAGEPAVVQQRVTLRTFKSATAVQIENCRITG